MLIVVIIVGILATAIVPRFRGYLAKTRDMKRQADLRNIAAAIQRYQSTQGIDSLQKDPPSASKRVKHPYLLKFATPNLCINNIPGAPLPLSPWQKTYWDVYRVGPVAYLKTTLAPYINQLPKDPNANQDISLIQTRCGKAKAFPEDSKAVENCKHTKWAMDDGDYLYFQPIKPKLQRGKTYLIAKVESPEYANWVGSEIFFSATCYSADQESKFFAHFCQSVQK